MHFGIGSLIGLWLLIWGINKMLAAQADRAAWHIDQDARQRERERQLREWRPEPPTLESRWRPLTAEDYNRYFNSPYPHSEDDRNEVLYAQNPDIAPNWWLEGEIELSRDPRPAVTGWG